MPYFFFNVYLINKKKDCLFLFLDSVSFRFFEKSLLLFKKLELKISLVCLLKTDNFHNFSSLAQKRALIHSHTTIKVLFSFQKDLSDPIFGYW